MTAGSQIPPGPATDANGNPALDPTRNVTAMLKEAIKRQDDLRESDSRHTTEVANLRASHNKELRLAEAERINAIRAVDVAAVAAAAQVSATQATTLAAQVAVSADAMRTQVAAAATAATVGLTAALDPIQKDIADLRRAQYEAQGQKTQVVEGRASNSQTIAVAALGASLFSGALVAILIKLFGG